MLSYLVPMFRVIRGVFLSWADPRFRNECGVLILLLASGTLFYSQIEGWRLLDALYFSFTTLTTIGYGDLSPQQDSSKVFTIFFAAAGIGLLLKVIQNIAQPDEREQEQSSK